MDVSLPPCGLYRTIHAVGSVPAGRLVYFHNHGNPGPGVYLPEGWTENRARFSPAGVTLPDLSAVASLVPVPREGFYRVTEAFYCCAQRCRLFPAEALVQLGYDAAATHILFVPEVVDGRLVLPERGVRVDEEHLGRLRLLDVPVRFTGPTPPTVH